MKIVKKIRKQLKKVKLLKAIFYFCLNTNVNLFYLFYKRMNHNLHVYNIDETADKIIQDKCSIVRFGDGEMEIITGHGINFQEYDSCLSEGLKKVLQSNENTLLVCIPDIFEGLDKYNKTTKIFWKRHLQLYGKQWENICKNRYYYTTFISRPYIDFDDKKDSIKYFEKIRKIYEGYDVVLVEGELSRLGCGNDLFKNVKSLKRILCPTKHAFRQYNKILAEVLKQDKDTLVLLSLGPTAKVLAYELYKKGYRVLDIGHIDIEYEWFLQGAKERIGIKNKFVNEVEVIGGKNEISDSVDEKYENEIIARIL